VRYTIATSGVVVLASESRPNGNGYQLADAFNPPIYAAVSVLAWRESEYLASALRLDLS